MLHILWHRKLTIVVTVVVCVAVALGYAKLSTKSYQSSALVQISAPSASATSGSTFSVSDPVQELSSSAVQLAAAKALHSTDPAGVAGQVSGTVDPTTGALTVTATGNSPAEAQAVAAAFSQAFVDDVQNNVNQQVDKYNAVLQATSVKIASLQGQLQPAGNPNATSANALLNAQINALTQTYSTLQTAQSTLQAGGPYASIQVAAPPGVSTGLSTSKLGAIGLLTGLLLGCGIAFIREQFDDSLRLDPDIESVIDGPLLGELPQDPDVKRGEVSIALVQSPQSSLSEAVRDLRTSLRVLLAEHQSPILVVTSPEPGDGKTFVTANLAASWALTGARVIVVSADFRRPRLEEAFGVEAGSLPGLSDLVKANWKTAEPTEFGSGGFRERDADGPATADRSRRGRRSAQADFDDTAVSTHLIETGIDGLQLLPVGLHRDNPSELFDSPGMQPVLDQLHLLADVILLDTPPVLSTPDTAILASLTHGAIIVASEGRTDRADLERTAHRLESTGCRIVGLVLNHVRRTTSDGYQAYGYGA